MKKLFFTGLIGLISLHVLGQQMSQQVLNSSGTVLKSTDFSLTFNIGEPITSTFNNTNNILSQGFIQPIKTDVPTSLLSLSDLDNNYNVFPTVTSQSITVEFSDKTIEAQKFEIYSSDGRLVVCLTKTKNYLDLSILVNGVYWLRPLVNNKQFGLKKIIKTF